jgi:hypothetical protein
VTPRPRSAGLRSVADRNRAARGKGTGKGAHSALPPSSGTAERPPETARDKASDRADTRSPFFLGEFPADAGTGAGGRGAPPSTGRRGPVGDQGARTSGRPPEIRRSGRSEALLRVIRGCARPSGPEHRPPGRPRRARGQRRPAYTAAPTGAHFPDRPAARVHGRGPAAPLSPAGAPRERIVRIPRGRSENSGRGDRSPPPRTAVSPCATRAALGATPGGRDAAPGPNANKGGPRRGPPLPSQVGLLAYPDSGPKGS